MIIQTKVISETEQIIVSKINPVQIYLKLPSDVSEYLFETDRQPGMKKRSPYSYKPKVFLYEYKVKKHFLGIFPHWHTVASFRESLTGAIVPNLAGNIAKLIETVDNLSTHQIVAV